MTAILSHNKIKYIPKEQLTIQRKYGKAIFIPKGQGIGELFNFFNQNKDSIKNITETVGNVAGAVSSVVNTGINTVKGIKEIQNMRKDKIVKEIIDDTEDPKIQKKGGSFFYV